MIPIISVVGWHNSGKTTFLEGLIPELKRRGLRVAVIKHARGGFEIDQPGTDTWRLAEAGADLVVISGESGLASIERRQSELPLEEIVSRLPPQIDLVITEGYKGASAPKIEVMRSDTGAGPIAPPDELLAIVTDGDLPNEGAPPAFCPTDVMALADYLQAQGFLRSHPSDD